MRHESLFARAGKALYGEAFQGAAWIPTAGGQLRVSERTIRRWCGDDSLVPQGVWRELERTAQRRADTLAGVAAEIRDRTDGDQP